jgi:1-acyl-sn-glycerol-3-phosphate acyltransferase
MSESPRLIKAYKHGWPRIAVEAMIRSRTRSAFHQVWAQGLDQFRESLDREPGGTLILANHSCWWDLFLAQIVNDAIPADGYGMMEHFNLHRFGFFRRIGGFSVDRTDPVSVRASLKYAAGLLQEPRAVVWIFPQGKIEGNDVRPLRFQNGIRALVRQAGRVRVVPMALRYEFWQDERPEALFRFGERTTVDRSDLPTLVPTFERRLTEELDALRLDSIAQRADRFVGLMAEQPSISDRYARFRARFRRPTPGAPT